MLKTYKVEGMTCCGCSSAVAKALQEALPGATIDVNVAVSEVTIEPACDDDLVKNVIEEAGFDYGGPL
ncbi:MAG: heavy-metal-associated domain-containing protein [Candidatus Polarisedimenticolaceae bacterium]|nr:heavy-metal-associated domain-containing protein [Candidatus Polarisedimenticolaceae bacterium]